MREDGVALLELAMVGMILLVLIGGTVDYGRAWRSGLSVNEAARATARVASALGKRESAFNPADNDDGKLADFYALAAAKAALESGGDIDGVERIVIFEAKSATGKVPTACTVAGGSGCTIIEGPKFRTAWDSVADPEDAVDSKGCVKIASAKAWCPTTRVNKQTDAEFFGVWIKYRQDNLFPVLGDDTHITRTAVMRLEPRVG